ncbi:MAG: RNA polymerase sigma factor [Planctomycetota bacterium]|jgi:RNA polymerase sigma-70 factor (ECF subfamily)
MDESSFVRASQNGDRIAFGYLVDRYYKKVYRLAYSYIGSHEEADDICQETFLRVLNGMKKLRDADRFGKWVFVIASNVLRKHTQKLKRDAALEEQMQEHNPGSGMGPPGALSAKERAAIVHEQLRKLPEQMRMVILLVLMEGFTQKEAAVILKCSEASVSRYFGMAKDLLRARLCNLIERGPYDE